MLGNTDDRVRRIRSWELHSEITGTGRLVATKVQRANSGVATSTVVEYQTPTRCYGAAAERKVAEICERRGARRTWIYSRERRAFGSISSARYLV